MVNHIPLADRMRPHNLQEFQGQRHLVGSGKILQDLIKSDKIPSMLFWGPPGTGKTTLAKIIANETKASFKQLSAVTAGVKDVRKIITEAEKNQVLGKRTILFIDEVHRFNKSQQDAFLPSVENGVITLIGATTENPSFKINNALLSRCKTFVLEPLSKVDLKKILKRALQDQKYGLGKKKIKISDKEQNYLINLSNGDARVMLNTLEIISERVKENELITQKQIEQALQKSVLLYDQSGEEHYNTISAFHKSMRGGDENATLYWLGRMLSAGEDPLYIARRIIRFASEDIGLANSLALPQAVAAYDACRFIGMPECGINLAQAAVYMAKSKKSIALYEAYENVMREIKQSKNLSVPLHLRNAPTQLMRDLNYGKDYKYTPKASKYENEQQEFLPKELKNKKWLNVKRTSKDSSKNNK